MCLNTLIFQQQSVKRLITCEWDLKIDSPFWTIFWFGVGHWACTGFLFDTQLEPVFL